jgi:hypothetical protein
MGLLDEDLVGFCRRNAVDDDPRDQIGNQATDDSALDGK